MTATRPKSRRRWNVWIAWLAAVFLLATQQLPVFAQGSPVQDFADKTILDFGAKLDGVTDDSAALQAYFDAVGPTGKIVIPEGGVLYLENPVTFDLQEALGFILECRSPIQTSATLENALTIQNGYPAYIEFW